MRTLGRALWQQGLAWGFSLVWIPIFLLLSALSLGRFSHTLGRRMLRVWGRVMLRIVGVRLVVSGRERLCAPAKRIATFNHASLLDIFVVCALLPDGGVPVVKHEVLYYPLLGQAVWLLDVLAIDRRNQYRARASLKAAAERMEREQLSVIIAPEGTRSRSGALNPFKLGAFHLALHSQAPLVPIVIGNSYLLQPRGQLYSHAGALVVRILPPISTADYSRDNLHQKAEALHALYQRELRELAQAEELP
jgi:lysophosphatidate acyltransferase